MVSSKIAILGFLAQSMLLISIFDIYFKSPIIGGVPDQKVDYEPPADRLVLFVADGLRADTFFDYANGNGVYFKYVKSALGKFFCETFSPSPGDRIRTSSSLVSQSSKRNSSRLIILK